MLGGASPGIVVAGGLGCASNQTNSTIDECERTLGDLYLYDLWGFMVGGCALAVSGPCIGLLAYFMYLVMDRRKSPLRSENAWLCVLVTCSRLALQGDCEYSRQHGSRSSVCAVDAHGSGLGVCRRRAHGCT